ncbi:hypothetical protein DFH08DRAFT_945078 [Mycena albidolilacea]|uniref:Uncharacterized protein n=1 Tax=Mycena albidolilacea TaxID=1033008 RepID=A0AAD6Z3N9_9AGAR|nr:hypothetical protein DFH08DRAFT_945078 [Mycena albidolilacea]
MYSGEFERPERGHAGERSVSVRVGEDEVEQCIACQKCAKAVVEEGNECTCLVDANVSQLGLGARYHNHAARLFALNSRVAGLRFMSAMTIVASSEIATRHVDSGGGILANYLCRLTYGLFPRQVSDSNGGRVSRCGYSTTLYRHDPSRTLSVLVAPYLSDCAFDHFDMGVSSPSIAHRWRSAGVSRLPLPERRRCCFWGLADRVGSGKRASANVAGGDVLGAFAGDDGVGSASAILAACKLVRAAHRSSAAVSSACPGGSEANCVSELAQVWLTSLLDLRVRREGKRSSVRSPRIAPAPAHVFERRVARRSKALARPCLDAEAGGARAGGRRGLTSGGARAEGSMELSCAFPVPCHALATWGSKTRCTASFVCVRGCYDMHALADAFRICESVVRGDAWLVVISFSTGMLPVFRGVALSVIVLIFLIDFSSMFRNWDLRLRRGYGFPRQFFHTPEENFWAADHGV